MQACWCEGMVTSGAGTPAVEAGLAAAMRPGATPAEGAERLGAPAFGFEKKVGVVALYYPKPGIEVTFQDGRLTMWRRTRPDSPAGPAAVANPGPGPTAVPAVPAQPGTR